ncbi:MAG: DUF2163 domain-containing protein [Proteobacteria bacterium]|nr:DUF2163 domain-containing protein [Pseudomonadota bacterium]
MLNLDPALAGHIAGGVTTLCRCWRLTRTDGTIFGFTDHDRDLTFAGTTFAASSGLAPSEVDAQLGLGVSSGEVSGALTGAELREIDIAAGLYDDATVESFLVNWADPDQRLLAEVATIGEIRRSETSFVAELRGPMHRYDQEQGRLFTKNCAADLGDGRCKVELGAHTITASVEAVLSRLSLRLTLAGTVSVGRFTSGLASFATGPNAGHVRQIRLHTTSGVIELWDAFPHAVEPGAVVTLIAGCDKTFATCRGTFANAANFRGFPDIPTPDFILTYARPGEGGHDGGRLDP